MTAISRSVLVANRGEIAVRIMRTLRAMGIRSVAVYTDPDRDAAARRGRGSGGRHRPGRAAYLDVESDRGRRQVAAGAAALHPGLRLPVGEPGAGPPLRPQPASYSSGRLAAAIEAMGDKINAKRTVAAAGVPVVPGRDEAGLTDDRTGRGRPRHRVAGAAQAVRRRRRQGHAARSMTPPTWPRAIAGARREALGAFGDATLLVERYVARPRHIEVQIFADTHGQVRALGERECSLQRRHQKIVEEAPSILLDEPDPDRRSVPRPWRRPSRAGTWARGRSSSSCRPTGPTSSSSWK